MEQVLGFRCNDYVGLNSSNRTPAFPLPPIEIPAAQNGASSVCFQRL